MPNKEDIYKEYLSKFLEPEKPLVQEQTFIEKEYVRPIPKPVVKQSIEPSISKSANKFFYTDVMLEELPLGKFYHPNTRIQIRAVKVGEIQHFSTIDNDSFYDIKEKLNDLLESCVMFIHPNGAIGSYKDLFDGDRLYMIYYLRGMTFIKGKILTVNAECECKNEEGKNTELEIELIRENIEKWKEDEEVWQYYNPHTSTFSFDVTFQDTPYQMAPPTIGIQQSFLKWAKDRKYKELPINEQFLRLMPFILCHISSATNEEINDMLDWFENHISEDEFFFLNDAINNYFKIGIKGLVKHCTACGLEVHTTKVFPRRASDLFIIPNGFRQYQRK